MEMFPVEAFAREEGPGFPTVYNRGLGGWRTEDMLATLDAQVTSPWGSCSGLAGGGG